MRRGQTWARSLLIIARSFSCQKEVEKESGTGMWLGTLPCWRVRQGYQEKTEDPKKPSEVPVEPHAHPLYRSRAVLCTIWGPPLATAR